MGKKSDRELVKRVQKIHKLLRKFGLRSWAYDPGVAAYDAQKRHLDFGVLEWAWLEPLLIELSNRRAAAAQPGDKAGGGERYGSDS